MEVEHFLQDLGYFRQSLKRVSEETAPVLFFLDRIREELLAALEDCHWDHESPSDVYFLVYEYEHSDIVLDEKHYLAALALFKSWAITEHLESRLRPRNPEDDRQQTVVGCGAVAPKGLTLVMNGDFMDAEDALLDMMQLLFAVIQLEIGPRLRVGERFEKGRLKPRRNVLRECIERVLDKHGDGTYRHVLTWLEAARSNDHVIKNHIQEIDEDWTVYWRDRKGREHDTPLDQFKNYLTRIRKRRSTERATHRLSPQKPARGSRKSKKINRQGRGDARRQI